MKNKLFLAVLLVALSVFPSITAAQFTAQEIKFLCAGGLSTRFDAEAAKGSLDQNGIRIREQDGKITVMQGDKILDSFEGATYSQYIECITSMKKSGANEPSIPRFDGQISYTYGNDRKFLNFLEANIGKVVFLKLSMDYEFVLQESYQVDEKCNYGNTIWEKGLSGQLIRLPLGSQGSSVANLECSEPPIAFVGKKFERNSAGPGAHWYDLVGFYRVDYGPGRHLNIEIASVSASADMWAKLSN